MKKGFLFAAIFFILSLVQVSFMPHFALLGFVVNIVMISLVLISSFASLQSGVAAAFAGGGVLDVYSSLPFGFWILVSLGVFFASQHILQNYVRIPQGF